MKKPILLLLALGIAATGCKKKEDKEETPAPSTPAPVVIDISLKQDGTELSCSSCAFTYKSGGLRGLSFNLPNVNEPMLLNFYHKAVPGTYPLVEDNPSNKDRVTFTMKRNGTFYDAVVGTINVTEVDTSSSGLIEKMKATFSFKTDTIAGKSYQVTDGVINFISK